MTQELDQLKIKILFAPDKGYGGGSTEIPLLQDPDELLKAVLSLEGDLTIDKKHTLKIEGFTITPAMLSVLYHKLDVPETVRNKRFEGYKKSFPTKPPILTFFTGALISTLEGQRELQGSGQPVPVSEIAEKLFVYLSTRPRLEADQETRENHVLFPEELEEAMKEVDTGLKISEGSIPSQLQYDLFTLTKYGIIVSPKAEEKRRGFTLLKKFLSIIDKLENPASADVLQKWIYDKSVSKPEEMINFLQTFVQFTAFLDSRAYVKIWKTEEGAIPLQPFHSLLVGVSSAIKYLREIKADNRLLTELTNIQELIIVRYKQIYETIASSDEEIAKIRSPISPSPDSLALIFSSTYHKVNVESSESYSEEAKLARNYLDTSGLNPDEILSFYKSLNDYDSVLAEAVLEELVKSNILRPEHTDDLELRQKMFNIRDACLELVINNMIEDPWIDIADQNLLERINPSTTQVNFYVVTGTFGPATPGHREYIESVLNLLKYQEEHDGDNTQYFLLLLPITRQSKVADKSGRIEDKDVNRLRTTYDRCASLILMLSDLGPEDRKKIIFTTTLQPSPERTKNIIGRVQATVNRLWTDVVDASTAKDKPLEIQPPKFIICAGSDEIERTTDSLGHMEKIVSTQRAKFAYPHVVVSRGPGDIVGMIEEADSIKVYLKGLTEFIVLVPTSRFRTGSRNARDKLLDGETDMFPIHSHKFLLEKWSKRSKKPIRGQDDYASITEIQQRLIEELKKLSR